jgi:hypothetical protein
VPRHSPALAAVTALLTIAFFAGLVAGDDSAELTKLKDELSEVEAGQKSVEADLAIAETRADQPRGEPPPGGDRGSDPKQHTNHKWGEAGRVGYLMVKPIEFTNVGSKWFLAMRARNESKEAREPFCGDAGATLEDARGEAYAGAAFISAESDNCAGELQPGSTWTFKSEFELPAGTQPTIASIYGDFEQENDVKTWDLP